MRKKAALEKAYEDGFALTFDDIRLRTGYSETIPDKVSLQTRFSRNVLLKIPIVSAAMDTVTEHKMAIELAKLGGIGVIHKNLSIEEQVREVGRVKHHLNGLIEKPICANEEDKVKDVLNKIEQNGYDFHSFPVLNSYNRLVGLLTRNDFEFCPDNEMKVRQIMTRDLVTARQGTSIKEAYDIMKSTKKKVLPLVSPLGEVVGMYIFSDVIRIVTGSAESYNVDSKGQLRVAASIGVGEEALERAKRLIEKNIDVIVIGTAHGDSKGVLDTLKTLKQIYPQVDVVVGNISTGESAKNVIEAGADGILVGQGPGSICTTRIIAGIGRPQVSAVYECSKIADMYDVPVCADGGLKNSGDITVAIAAGAHSVMMGSMLAGTEETPGSLIFVEGRQWKSYRGMGSLGALEAHKGSRERYHQPGKNSNELIPEGVEGLVPYKGSLKNILIQYVGGLKSGMGYVGAKNIQELRDKGEFDRITGAGLKESHPHDIKIAKDAPNYKEI
jgi:IMP dehydrogenase